MSGPGSTTHAPPTLASRPLPRRVRELLEGILEYTSDEFERGLMSALNEFEQQLFKFAEQARSNATQTRWLEAQRLVKRTRPDLVPRFLVALEAELATIRDNASARGLMPARSRLSELSLVNELEMDEVSVLTELSNRAELRNSLPLYLLGQRFGVLAARPALDADTLPIGPQAVCRMVRSAADCLELGDEHRLMFFRIFDRQVMPLYGSLVEAVNTYLAKHGVLPHLQYVPVRARPTAQATGKPESAARPRAEAATGTFGLAAELAPQRPATTTRPPITTGDGEQATASDLDGFQLMRQLLAGRRQLLGKLTPDRMRGEREAAHLVEAAELQAMLGQLQLKPPGPVVSQGKAVQRSIAHLKQDLLALLRQSAPEQQAAMLSDEDNDAIELLGMLYDSLMKDVKPASPASALLLKLQVPLLRVALQDKGFFTRQQHPARQLLNTIAETGAYWLSEDEADDGLVEMMNSVVDRTAREFSGDVALFGSLLTDLSSHLQMVARKAEVAERRHVEAARGKEKLTVARDRAAAAVESLLRQQNLPRFTHTLLSQAWTDVMALTALRQGDDSPAWRQQLGLAEQLIKIARATPAAQAKIVEEQPGLMQEVESALAQVGYQGDEASAIAQRLVDPQGGAEDDAASRTELTMRLKARARLGEEVHGRNEDATALSAAEQACLDRIRQTPFGTWFEFTTNQQGERARRRLSWFSTVTGHALFVNHRGQKVGDHMLDALARMMARGELRLVEEEKGSLIDRAWNGVMNALRSFAGQASEAVSR